MSLQRLADRTESSAVSFEFFPPKTAEMEAQLWNYIRRLAPLRPHFVSVTYGAGGSTRDRTHATVKRIVEETELKPAAHLTCVGAPREDVDAVIRQYWESGVRHIVALRGDMPEVGQSYCAHASGYESTADLVRAIRRIAPFEISVSAYPEVATVTVDGKRIGVGNIEKHCPWSHGSKEVGTKTSIDQGALC